MSLIKRSFKRIKQLMFNFNKEEITSLLYDTYRLTRQHDHDKILEQLQEYGLNCSFGNNIKFSFPSCITIGNNVHIGHNNVFRSEGGITIGDNTHIGDNVTILTYDENYKSDLLPFSHEKIFRPVAIGRNVSIESHCLIKPGISIGEGAIIKAGSIVEKDIPSMRIYEGRYETNNSRNKENYLALDKNKSYAGKFGFPLKTEQIDSFKSSNTKEKGKFFFVLTTGRSGSKSIAEILSQHPGITCKHEPRGQMIRISSEFANGTRSKDDTIEELRDIYTRSSVFPAGKYGESDQKFFNLGPMLDKIFEEPKYIWLLRDGRDVVSSTYSRGWYSDDIANRGKIREIWDLFRLQGNQTGDISENEWNQMSPFEKNCWYWQFVNNKIENFLKDIPANRKFALRIEDFEQKSKDVQNFLSVVSFKFDILRSNKANYKLIKWQQWDDNMKDTFKNRCGGLMDKFYPEWDKEF